MSLVLIITILVFIMPVRIVVLVWHVHLLLILVLVYNMCTAPIYIKNPYYHIGGKGLNHLHDTRSAYVRVPCGKCKQCLSLRQGYYNQRFQMESLRSELFYCTLTYARRGICFTAQGEYKVAYPNYDDIQNMFKRLRKLLPHPIRYFCVSEYGTQRHRPHFHLIIAVEKQHINDFYRGSILHCEKSLFKLFLSEWRRNIGSRRNPKYMKLCDYIRKNGRSTYDFHHVQPIINHDNDLSFYVTKYLLKYDKRTQKLLDRISIEYKKELDAFDLCNEDCMINYNPSGIDYKLLISQIKPRAVFSKDFGDYRYPGIKKYIESCLSRFKDIPSFFDINTGRQMLLSPYYRKHLLPLEYRLNNWYDYVKKLRDLNILFPYHSTNYDLFDDDTIYDLNCDAMKSIRESRSLNRLKNHLNRKI